MAINITNTTINIKNSSIIGFPKLNGCCSTIVIKPNTLSCKALNTYNMESAQYLLIKRDTAIINHVINIGLYCFFLKLSHKLFGILSLNIFFIGIIYGKNTT